jgi:uncharacterized membrane protein (UPF0127 family)
LRQVQVSNRSQKLKSALVAVYADGYFAKLRGLAFRRSLAADRGLLLVEGSASRLSAGIHMFGVAFDLAIIWLDADLKVVDLAHARRWRSLLFPRKPARYVLECAASRLSEFHLGDQLVLKEVPAS